MIGKRRKEGLVPMRYVAPSTMFHEMERMFDELMPPWVTERMMPIVPRTRMPSIDIREMEDNYQVEAELPGIAKEDIEIQIAEGSLEIKAESEREEEEEKEGYIRKERGRTSFYRRLTLPEDIDEEGIAAKMTNGVLTITLPKVKVEEPSKKKVEVE
jgi:HSP20 family molecular chaperone IbpA